MPIILSILDFNYETQILIIMKSQSLHYSKTACIGQDDVYWSCDIWTGVMLVLAPTDSLYHTWPPIFLLSSLLAILLFLETSMNDLQSWTDKLKK